MKQKTALFLAAFALLAGASALSAQGPQSLTMTNAEVVSVDASQRLMVIRNTLGKEQTVELDDQLAGFGGIRAGDKVVLSLRRGQNYDRVMALSKGAPSAPAAATRVATPSSEAALAAAAVASDAAAPSPEQATLAAYADRVATLSQQANEVDRLWGELRTACKAIVDAHHDSREWVSLWDKQARLDLSSGSCRDLYNQVLAAGETVNAAMASTAEAARKAGVASGELRQIRQRYSMDWEGWGRTPPERLGQP